MVERRISLALEFRDDALGQDLPQLDAPLVERIEVLDRALSKNRVLIMREHLAERFVREPHGKNGVRRPIALKDAVRHKSIRRPILFDLLCGLAESERLGLGEPIREQSVVKPAWSCQCLIDGCLQLVQPRTYVFAKMDT